MLTPGDLVRSAHFGRPSARSIHRKLLFGARAPRGVQLPTVIQSIAHIKRHPQVGVFMCTMVEMRGVEPLSETVSSETSPGADSVWKFPFGQNPLSGMPAGSFINTTEAQSFANEVVPFNLSRVRSAGNVFLQWQKAEEDGS